MLGLLGILAGLSLIASDLPAAARWPLACLAAGYGAWLARAELRKPHRELVIDAQGAQTSVDGESASDFSVDWRGPLAFVRWRDTQDRRQRLVWWPDTLPVASRRELRLAVPAALPARHTGSMAT